MNAREYSEVIKNPENTSDYYAKKLDHVLSAKLSPENISDYANHALTEIIGIVEEAVGQYQLSPTIRLDSKKAQEQAAFSYFGLQNIESILDHVADLSERISEIDTKIENAEVVDAVIIPPDAYDLEEGDEEWQQREQRIAPRTKTVLFVLEEDFGLNVTDSEVVSLKTGTLPKNMRRGESYHVIEAPEVNRVVFVNDEIGNITFVFDTDRLREKGLSSDELMTFSKTKLKALMDDTETTCGITIKYDQATYVSRIKQAIAEPLARETAQKKAGPNEENESYLIPRAPEGFLTVFGISKKLGVTRDRVKQAIDGLGESLGEVGLYRFGRVSEGYSPDQIRAIHEYLTEHTNSFAPLLPEGFLSANQIRKKFDIGNADYITDAIATLGETLGEVGEYKVANRTAKAYSPDQIAMILAYLEQYTTAFMPNAPEDYMSNVEIAGIIQDASVQLVNACVEEILNDPALSAEMGEVKRYKFNSKPTYGYSPLQANYLISYVKKRGSKSHRSKLWAKS